MHSEFDHQYDRTVREEIEVFRRKAEAFLAGEIPEDEFRPLRLKHGIYGQRQPGVQMVRCKIPGGVATSRQLEQFARIAEEFGGGRGHLTTRQNIQYHFVPLAGVAGLMHLLADVGLTNREACYDTVRNVTACPWSGIARDEVFDVRPYAQRLAYAFLRKELTGNLPRKFKIAFDGCAGQDCIASAINDIGLRAVVRDGRRGFRMGIGGGLGPLPTEAQRLDEFVPEERLLNRCEAVIRVFNQYGNRSNRNKARMKFVLRERGIEWLKEHIEIEYADILANGGIAWPARVPEGFGGYQSEPQPLGDGALLPVLNASRTGEPEYDAWIESNVEHQKQTGYAAVTVRVDQGNLTGVQLRGLARISSTAGDGLVRVAIAGVEHIVPLLGIDRMIGQGIDQLSGGDGALDRLIPGLSGALRQTASASMIENFKKMGEPTTIENRPATILPLRFSDGAIYLGMLRVGDAHPLLSPACQPTDASGTASVEAK